MGTGLAEGSMGGPLVPASVTLAFDPASITESTLRHVFDDRLARTIWMAFKWRHLVNQHLEAECLAIAARLHEKPVTTWEELRLACRVEGPRNFCGGVMDQFYQELLPRLAWGKEIAFVVAP
jgi:hypothetical protein